MADSGHPPAELHERLLICRTIKLNAGAHGGHRRCCLAQMQKNAQNKPQIARLILCVHTTLQVYCNLFLTFCLQIPCTSAGVRDKGDILFREREYPLWNLKRKAFRLAVSGLNDLDASGMEMPARGVAAFSSSIRFGLLLFSLSLCLRFVTLTQFPTTSDLYKLAIACQGGIAGARRNIRTIGRR